MPVELRQYAELSISAGECAKARGRLAVGPDRFVQVADGGEVLHEPEVREAILDVCRQRGVGFVRVRLTFEPECLECCGKCGPRQGLTQGGELEQIVEFGSRIRQQVVLEQGLRRSIAIAAEDEHPARARLHPEVAHDDGRTAAGRFRRRVAEDFISRPQPEAVARCDQDRLADDLPVKQKLH